MAHCVVSERTFILPEELLLSELPQAYPTDDAEDEQRSKNIQLDQLPPLPFIDLSFLSK